MRVQSIDRFVEDRRARWARLGALVERARGRVARLQADEVLELGQLYRAATGDLAIARRDFARDAVTERLNDVVAAAHALVYSEAPTSPRRLRRVIARELPATVRANLRFVLAAFVLFAVPAVVTYTAGLIQPDLALASLGRELTDHLARRTPGSEIPDGLRALVGPLIIVNNVWIALVVFAGGMTAGLLTSWALVVNGAFFGTTFAALQVAGGAGYLVEFVLGHGFLELSAIFLAGGAGLLLAWAILRPGERSRGDALRLAGAQAVRIVMLVAVTLVVAGIIEAYVSATALPILMKLAIGLITGALLWGYILVGGRARALARSGSSATSEFHQP